MFGAVDARDPWVPVAPVTRRHVSGRVVGGVGMADEGTADTGLDPPFVPFMDPGRDRIDLDGDGAVATQDVLLILSEFGCTSSCTTDINVDGFVAIDDFLFLLGEFGNTCE